MHSLFKSGRSSRFANIAGFQPASTLLKRQTRPRNLWNYNKISYTNRMNIKRFQLYNNVTKTWAKQINQSPILLTESNIKNWRSFRANNLKTHTAS